VQVLFQWNDLNELGLLFGIMPAAGRFDWLSDKVIAFGKQLENKDTKNKTL